MADQASAKDFSLKIIQDFSGYVSSVDRTKVSADVMVQGSQNVYKKLSGTISVRPGQKRRGAANTTLSPISSEFVWNTSWGATYPLMIANNNLYVEYNLVWYSLLSGLTKTRYVFDKWWNDTEKKDRVSFVCGDSNIYHWSGGITKIAASDLITSSGNSASITSYVAVTGLAPLVQTYNGLLGTSLVSTLALTSNPTDGKTLIFDINGTSITITFVSTIGIVAGNVLIGANLHATMTNLLGLLTAPGTTNSTQVALLSGNQTLIGYLTSVQSSTLQLLDTTSIWMKNGFSSTTGEMTMVINGTTYTYTGGQQTNTLTGVTPSPAGEASGSIAIQPVITASNKPASDFSNDFIKVIGNQAYVGSYTSRFIYVSSNTDFTNFTLTTPPLDGDPALLVMDSTSKGISVKGGNPWIGYGTGEWAEIVYSQVSNGTSNERYITKNIKPITKLGAPYAHEFITNSGDNIIYLAQDQQVRELGDFNNLFTAGYPSLSQQINSELAAENFTGGGCKAIGDFLYLTAPCQGRHIYTK